MGRGISGVINSVERPDSVVCMPVEERVIHLHVILHVYLFQGLGKKFHAARFVVLQGEIVGILAQLPAIHQHPALI